MVSKCYDNNFMARVNLAQDFKDFLNLCLKHEVRFMVAIRSYTTGLARTAGP